MRIRISHHTGYTWSQPARSSVQYLRLTPRSSAVQTVVEWRIGAPGNLSAWTDQYGNACHTLVVTGALGRLDIAVDGVCETADTGGVFPAGKEILPPAAFLAQTACTRADDRIRDFAAPHLGALAGGGPGALHDLMAAVHDAVVWAEGATHVHTTAAEALAAGRGVCQDHAHLFIAVCRLARVPARYVSGYLCTDGPDEIHSASHAWAEALVPDLGWVGFDAANASCPTPAYVRLATGTDYFAASPVRGVRHGSGDEAMAVRIRLEGEAGQTQ